MRRLSSLVVGVIALACVGRAIAGSYAAPQDVYVSTRAMEALSADIAAGRPTDAVDRIETIFNDPVARLVRTDDKHVVSIQAWVNAQLTDHVFPLRFREQYEKVAGQAAQNALVDAVHSSDVPAMMAVAERYPWTLAAQQAPIEAAQRLIGLGDVRGAKDLIGRVTLDDKAPAALRALATLPDDSTLEPAAFSTGFIRAKPASGVLAPAAMVPRLVPVASSDAVYLAAPHSMLALNKQGRMLWSVIDPAPEIPPPPTDLPKSMEGLLATDASLARPAVWCDPAGTPRVLVARQSTSLRSSLRAVRPLDGSVIWTTVSSEPGGELLYVGAPTISGRYVYSLAVSVDPARGHRLCLVALELASGRVLFNTEIGAAERRMAQQVRAGKGEKEPDPMLAVVSEFVFRDSTTIHADERNVYVVPGGGAVWCIDRFGGAIRWVSQYPARVPLTPQQEREAHARREQERQARARQKLPPLPAVINVRWQNNALANDTAVVVAPTDSNAVVAFDISSGKTLWNIDTYADAELAAVQAEVAVLVSATRIVGLRTGTGEPAWEAPLSAEPTGPAFVDGDCVGVVSTAGVSEFSISTGQPEKREPGRLLLDNFLRTPVTRTLFQTANLLAYFGDPPAPPVPEKPERPAKPDRLPRDKNKKGGDKPLGAN